ncbi:serine hydrolase [Paracoccus nototheniae]|uniref:Serine hydrolase domain-containing protein n=1 Tax=Paracoccus nototheniae TaxID=2489002 RepID=A0ABW4DZV2_9RHOB|nr:serine hydrolase [Paracoccus nototheniae]
MIDDLKSLIDRQPTAALTVWQSGQVTGSFGPQDHRFLCHSIRKSILAALIGIEVHAGRLDLGATLESLGIDDKDPLSSVERQASVYDLLTARSGIYHPAGYETEWMGMIKERRHSHAPGTFWCYNNWDFNALGTIYVKASGHSVAEGFTGHLATPLGLQDFRPGTDAWVETFAQSCHDAYPLRLSNRDLLRFCQLYLQGGVWEGRQVLPASWTQLCTLRNSDAGPRGAYGYMWWLERDGCGLPNVVLPKGSFMAIGAGGHYALVMPDRDAIVLHRVDTDRGDTVSGFQFGSLLSAILQHLD